MSVVLVAGTNGWRNDSSVDWYVPGHRFGKYLKENGIEIETDGPLPFIWSTDLDGVLGEAKGNVDWAAGGAALSYFVRMKGKESVDIVAHSHGLQVVLYAIAFHGLKVRHLMTFGSPVRKDMEKVAVAARQNITKWIHIYSDKSDKWQIFGELFDGHFGIVRKHPLADENDFVPKVGHTELLEDPKQYHYWTEKGWLDFLKG